MKTPRRQDRARRFAAIAMVSLAAAATGALTAVGGDGQVRRSTYGMMADHHAAMMEHTSQGMMMGEGRSMLEMCPMMLEMAAGSEGEQPEEGASRPRWLEVVGAEPAGLAAAITAPRAARREREGAPPLVERHFGEGTQ